MLFMHALFFLKHSQAGDEELRFALRGIAAHAPFVDKVWIFGVSLFSLFSPVVTIDFAIRQ
jgi:hypothetical protein